MKQAPPKLFQSRVGRKVLLLFIVTALLPLAAMALLSLTQVRDLLLEQASGRLASATKAYATAVYDRLLTARDVVNLLAAHPKASTVSPIANARGFTFLARVDSNGKSNTLVGTLTPESEKLIGELRQQKLLTSPQLRFADDDGLYLIYRPDETPDSDILIGKLASEHIWGNIEDRKESTVVCVVELETNEKLYCPGGNDLNLARKMSDTTFVGAIPEVVWMKNDVRYRGRIWPQFMRNDFHRPDWYFAVSVPENEVLAAVDAFRQVFFPVVLLTLLLIAWLSYRQIRAIVIPLGKLTHVTRRVTANDFSARANVDSKDEFGELGDALNSMSVQLGHQFQVSRVHSEIDRQILERNALSDIIEATLIHAAILIPSIRLCVVLLDNNNQDIGRFHTLEACMDGVDHKLVSTDITTPQSTWPDLSLPGLSHYQQTTPTAGWLMLAKPKAQSRFWTQALTWGKAQCGWLVVLQDDNRADVSKDDQRMIGELAGRLAIAVASAWREDELFQRAHFDALTGLPNRSLFNDRLQHAITRGRREGNHLAIMFVDLDHFKSVNDTQGHGAGDTLLCEAADRIKSTLRESDTVSRYGGDEFTILLSDIHEQRDALMVGQNIITALKHPFTIDGQDSFLSATIGIAIFPDNGDTSETLLKHADTAMYRAKTAGRGQALFFEERMNAEAMASLTIERELRQAIENQQLALYYQPQVSPQNYAIVSCEALMRWHHPVRGTLPPGEFIKVAEDVGLIGIMGRWAIEETCRQLQSWRAEGVTIDRASVNVSAIQFRESDFVDHIRAAVFDTDLAPSLELEITESVLLEQPDVLAKKLKEISEFGCSIALDDFGTGFSSLAYLKTLPFDVVKIDRLFIDDIDRTADGRAFVEAIISMSHVLGKKVIAEGVERESQMKVLRELQCDLAQGFYISKPISAQDFSTFVANFPRRS